MRFPKRLLTLLAKIALDKIMSPERTEELFQQLQSAVDEIKKWGKDTSPNAKAVPSVQDIEEAVGELSSDDQARKLSDDQLKNTVDLTERLVTRFAEKRDDAALDFNSVKAIVESELPGRANTYVLWIDLDGIVPDGAGRFVHFSWAKDGDRMGYKIRDFISERITYPSDKPPSVKNWTRNPTDLTAEQIWKAAKHRIPTVKATGLGVGDLGPVEKNRDVWKAVLNALTKNLRRISSAQGIS